MILRSGYAFTLPAYDRRGVLEVLVPVAARIIGDDVSELHPYVAGAATIHGYELTPSRWEHREVQYVQYADEGDGAT
jgi:hypothetical protein